MPRSMEREDREPVVRLEQPPNNTTVPFQGGVAPPVPGRLPNIPTPGATGGRPAGTGGIVPPGVPGSALPPPPADARRVMEVPGMRSPPMSGEAMRPTSQVPGAPPPDAKAAAADRSRGVAEGAMGVSRPLAGGGSVSEVAPGRMMTNIPGKRPEITSATGMNSKEVDEAIRGGAGKVTTPAGTIEADETTGKKRWTPSPDALRTIESHRENVMRRMDYPGRNDPNSPKPPALPGVPFFNPFSGVWESGDTPPPPPQQGAQPTSMVRQSSVK